MKTFSQSDIAAEPITGDGVAGVKVQWLIDPEMGAKHIAMRRFEFAPGGHTPYHSHPWEHEMFILSGEGVVVTAEGERRFGAGDVVFMPSGEEHNFRNDGQAALTFLCVVPTEGQTCRRQHR